jgi:hypothetical protein
MPAAKKKPATKKKAAATKAAPTAASPAASPAGPDPGVVLGYQLGKSLFWQASPHFIVAGPWTAFCTFVLMPSKTTFQDFPNSFYIRPFFVNNISRV